MRDGEGGGHRQAVIEQRALRFPGQVPHQRDQDDEADFKENRQSHQERGGQHGPHRAVAAEFQEQPVGERAPTAGMLEEPPDHRHQTDHYGDEPQSVAESGLHGLEHFLRSHAGG